MGGSIMGNGENEFDSENDLIRANLVALEFLLEELYVGRFWDAKDPPLASFAFEQHAISEIRARRGENIRLAAVSLTRFMKGVTSRLQRKGK